MSMKTKKISDIERRDRAIEKVRNEEAYANSLNNLAMQRDLKERFGEYDKDVSVGDMYQRKKKIKKTKSKRKTKGCGCK